MIEITSDDCKPWWETEEFLRSFAPKQAEVKGKPAIEKDGMHKEWQPITTALSSGMARKAFTERIQRLDALITAVLAPELEQSWRSKKLLLEIWRSTTLRSFVYSDFIDPRVIHPRQRTMVDVLMRALAVLPLVTYIPDALRKESIARVLTQRFIELSQISPSLAITLRLWISKRYPTRRSVYTLIRGQIQTWHLFEDALVAAAPVVVVFVGQDWNRFLSVFRGLGCHEAIARASDPRARLLTIRRRAETEVGRGWESFDLKREVFEHLNDKLKPLINLSNGLFCKDELLWHIFRFDLGMEYSRTLNICKEWLSGSIARRIEVFNRRLENLAGIEESRLFVRKPESTQRLVMLYIAGTYSYAPLRKFQDKAIASMYNRGNEPADAKESDEMKADREFIDTLLRTRITFLRRQRQPA